MKEINDELTESSFVNMKIDDDEEVKQYDNLT